MQDFHEGGEVNRPFSSSTPQGKAESPRLLRLEQVGDLHYDGAAYSSAMEYYRSALRVQSGAGAVEAGRQRARLHRKCADCFLQQGHPSEARLELAHAEELLPDDEMLDRAVLHVRHALVLFRQGAYERAYREALDSLSRLAVSDRHREVGNAQMILGNASLRLGRPEKAREFFQDALATFRRVQLYVGQAQALHNLAILAKNECRWSHSLRLFERARKIVQEHGHSHELAGIFNGMAVLHRKMGHRVEAMALVEQGLELGRNLGDQNRLTRLKLLRGQLLIDDGRFAEAEQTLLEARVLAERRQVERDLVLADEFLGDLMAAQGLMEEARLNYELAEDRARSLGTSNDLQVELLRRRAELDLRSGEHSEAIVSVDLGLEMAEVCGERFEVPYLLRVRGLAKLVQKEFKEARTALDDSLSLFKEFRLNAEKRQGLFDLSHLHMEEGGRKGMLAARACLREIAVIPTEGSKVDCRRVQEELARVELALGNYEEALLALYELERIECTQPDAELDLEIQDLRAEIESALGHEAKDASERYNTLAHLPDLLETAKADLSRNLRSVLVALGDRLEADRGLLAVRDENGRARILATLKLSRSVARQLAENALGFLDRENRPHEPRVWTKLQADTAWTSLELQGMEKIASAVALPVVGSGPVEGLLYLDRNAKPNARLGFSNEALAVATTYVEVLRSAILDAATDLRGKKQKASFLWDDAFENIITESDAMVEVLRLCSKVAPSPYTVLFTGETGTGKGLLAYALHKLSPLRDEPFVSVNCAAIPEGLLESELFGHVKGSFTGADRDHPGLIAAADGGTLFLDEVGKMSLPMQGKLLQFLDSSEIRPVGGSALRRVDVRILCASKRNLKKMVGEELFLEDLYYRLLDFPIEVPPLRQRADDILLLARHYLQRTADELGIPAPQMSRGFGSRLRSYSWPGNVRELEKTMRRSVLLSSGEGTLRISHLPEGLAGDRTEMDREGVEDVRPLKIQLAELEKIVIEKALNECGWNRSAAARRLRISYPTLLLKIKLYGLKRPS